MIKKYLILLYIYAFSSVYCQSGIGTDNNFQNKNIFSAPSTAEAYSFSKVGKLPMDLFRGKANVDIPIYTVITDGISIPISLSYNTGGIKLNEIASTVGLGWSLNIPGTINKNVIGKDDDQISFFSKDINTYASYNGYVSHNSFDDQRRDNLWNIYYGSYDTKPDLYQYSLPGLSGSFIMGANNAGLTIPYENIKIEKIPSQFVSQRKFQVTDASGNMFWFSPKNASSFEDPTNPVADQINSSLFRIDSLRTVNKNVVKFFYQKQFGYTEKNVIERMYTKMEEDYDPGNQYFHLPPSYEKWNTETSSTENLISKIEFPEGIIEFKYSDEGLAIENGVLYRKDINSTTGLALKKIIVRNKSTRIVKDYSLNYEYFSSNNINKTYEDYRLKLVNIYDALSQSYHRFTYNEDYPMPGRNSNNEDYWGYINNLSNTSAISNLPYKIHTEIQVPENRFPFIQRRDRSPNPVYAQIGTLKSIEYPTKGKKNIYYETPITDQINTYTHVIPGGIGNELISIGNPNDINTFNDIQTYSVTINASDVPFNENIDFNTLKFGYGFSSGCLTAETIGDATVHPNPDDGNISECFGLIRFTPINDPAKAKTFTSNGRQFQGEFLMGSSNIEFPVKVDLWLSRMGYCNCSAGGGLSWRKSVNETTATQEYLGGLRIKKIEDIDQNNISNVFEYKYGKFNLVKNKFENISVLKQPYNFTRIDKKVYRKFDDNGVELSPNRIQKFFTLSNSNQSSASYGSSDIVTYPFVIEESGLGKILYEFSDKFYESQSLFPTNIENYNDWKYGLPLNQKYVNKDGQTVKTVDYEYNFNTLKNALSNFNTNDISKIAFASDMIIIPSKIQLMPGPGSFEGDIFYVENTTNYIESAKIENVKTIEKDFLSGNIIEKSTLNTYTDTEIAKPINLKNTTSIFPSGEKVQTSYEYAHEKGNQLMISKNMISIPLETSTTQTIGSTTKTLSRTETIYPKTAAEITNNTASLILPLSAVSYDLQNNLPSTEATYDRYDVKGNIQQYTTKAGISTTIIWGYNKNHPIAKIEGAKLSDISQSLIENIVNASDNDAQLGTDASEQSLVATLDLFRNNSALSGYQISTYTYNPLIGVTSITPPSGIREVYIYDTANRLKEIRENSITGKILKEFKYNYKQ